MYISVNYLQRGLQIALLLACASLATSCTSTPPPAPKPEVSFTKFQPISLNVADINVTEEYKPPMKAPYVEHLMPYSPADAMKIWVKDRLKAVGSDDSLQVIIRNASVVARDLPKPDGMEGFFTDSQDRRYDAKLVVELRIYKAGDAMSQANIEITATQSDSINQAATVEERDIFFRKLIIQLMDSANSELERQIFKYFNPYIVYSQTP